MPGRPAMDLDDLYRLLPGFLCTPGCHECCRSFGVPSRTKVEDERIRRFIADKRIEVREARGTTCPYLVVGLGCAIYPARPLICRLYGTSPSYRCKMGASPVRLLHEDEEADIFHFYHTRFF
jgi:Fe-S-cluster containining protein